MELRVLERSRELGIEVFKIANSLPEKERFGLYSQITRAVISIGSNLAEGSERTDKEFINFIRIARGSAMELDFQLSIIGETFGIDVKIARGMIDEIMRMTYNLRLSLKTQDS